MLDKLKGIEERFAELERRISDPAVIANNREYAQLARERSSLMEVIGAIREYRHTLGEIADHRTVFEGDDEDLRELAKGELTALQKRQTELDETIKHLISPRDPYVDQKELLEINAGTVDWAVRTTQIPTGMVIVCRDEKSQHKNKARALKILRARLLEAAQAEQDAKMAATRKSMVGTGDRSERIRTYNFPQSRVTDHRVNLTLHQLDQVLDGAIDPLIDALATREQAEALST